MTTGLSSFLHRFFSFEKSEKHPQMKINKTRPDTSTTMAVNKKAHAVEGLGNRALLDKMDKLRELGISDMVSLPQMVVVGDQSAGKSSVLESLTGFHFPRSVSLCTRHATEIICRREERESIRISVHCSDTAKANAKGFPREATDLGADEFAKIFEDAAEVMGIKSQSDNGSTASAFSRDVLKVEISGPTEDHLTVIDVPGMFENVTEGLTTKSDITLVKDMVQSYIKESRTIILAVVPSNGDIANQKILTYAREADPEGKRTLGVLTKPDLLNENATRNVVLDLVRGKRRDLQLGYCLVKNRGADDISSSAQERDQAETNFFREAPWNTLPKDRLGIPALRTRIQQLLMDRTKSEFPKVRAELSSKLKEREVLLKDLGESRSTTEQQRIYVGKIAAEFNQIKNFGLDAYYNRHKIFHNPELKLITRIREINEQFSEILFTKGHTRHFVLEQDEDEEEDEDEEAKPKMQDYDLGSPRGRGDLYDNRTKFKIPLLGEDELDGILCEAYGCPVPSSDDIMEYIEMEYLTSRGYEMGTFSGEMLPTTFKEQAEKWPMIARAHVSNAILVVHHFVRTVLDSVCPDPTVRSELWSFLLDELQKRYKRAVEHAEFLLEVEFEGKSITYNPDFEEVLADIRSARAEKLQHEAAVLLQDTNEDEPTARQTRKYEFKNELKSALGDVNTVQTMRKNIHDVLQSFYDIARSRFVDVVCQQVIDHFLLHAVDSPLAVLSDAAVLKMAPEQLEAIAGEDLMRRELREELSRDIADLTQALKILKA